MVSWGSVSNASSYTLQERIGSGSWSTIQNTAATSRSISGKGNQTYGYRVAACNDLGCSSYTAEKIVQVAVTPSVPPVLVATADNGNIDISWSASSGTVTRYDLDESVDGGTSYTNLYDGVELSKHVENRVGTYQYRIRACSLWGSYESCSGWRYSEIANTYRFLDVPALSNTSQFSVRWTSSALGSFQQAYALLQEQVDGSWVTLEGASVGTIGQRDFSRPDGTYTFGLYDCKVSAGQAGTSTSCNTVLTKTVVVDAPAPVVNASFNKSSINEAASANLTWSASGASTCSATGIVGVSGLSGTVTYSAPTEVLSAFTQSVVLTCTGFGGVTSKTVNLLVNPVNDPPTISSIPSITARINTTSNPVSFAVNDVDNNNGSLTLKVLSTNNSALLPITNVSFGGTAGGRTLRVSPVAGQAGNATLVIQVSDGHLTASTSVNVEVREGPVIPIFSGNPLETVADPLNDTLSGDVYYGGVKGAYSVGNDGSFRYDVPFIVPVGVQGIAPNVGVSYNSGRRNSIIGWGWELTGFSFIHRCPADYHRDGRTSGVRDEDNYQYCLDGARLVSVGSDQYRTENETFLHITKHNDYWTVVDQSGTSSRYGYDQNAKELSANGTHTWKLDRQEDTFGNYLTVTYDAGQVNGADYSRPSNITYTQNDSLAYMPKRELIFNYSPRNDIISGFRSGKEYIENKRLSSVTVKNNGSELWTWRLRYEDENSNKVVDDPAAKSQLDSIQRCFKSNSCEEALTINWAPRRLADYQYVSMDNTFSERRTSLGEVQHYFDIDGDGIEDGYSDYADTATLSYVDDVSGAQTFVPESEFIDIDINNDGYKDIVRINPTISGVLVYLNEADGNGGRRIAATANSNYSVNKTNLSFQGVRRYHEYMNIGTEFQSSRVHRRTATYGYNIKFVDFNRDGLVDLVRIPPDCTNGSFFCFFESEPYPQDISVLINTDQGWRKTNNQLHFAEIYNQWGNQNSETAIQFMDLNGDGFLDIYAAGRDPENKVSYLYYLLHNGASDIDNVTLTDVTSSSGWGLLKEYLGDFDGDGVTDFATVPALSSVNGPTAEVISVRRGRGGSYTEATVALADAGYLPGCAQGHSPLSYCIQTVVDFNNDGLDDIVQMSGCQYSGDLKYNSEQERQSLSQEISRCIQQMNSTGGWNAEQVWLSKGIDANGDIKFAAPVIYRKDSSISFAYARISMSQFSDYNGDGIKENNPGFTPAFKELRVESIQSHAQDITIQYQSFDMTSVLLNSGDAFGDPQLKQLYRQNDSYIDGMQVKRSATQFGVSSLDISNGVGGTNKIEYRYAGAKYDTASYGHLGFKTIESTEYVDGEDNYIRTESHYHQEANNLYSLPRKLKRRVRYAAENGNETLLSDIRYKWKVRLYEDDDDGHQSPHFFAYIYEQSEKTSDLSGSAMSTTVTRHYASNNYACTELSVNDTESIATYYAGSAEDTDYDDDGILLESLSIICDADSNDALAPTAMTQIVAMQNADVINLGARRGLVQTTRNASWFGPSSGLPVGDLWSQAVNGINSSASCSIVQGQSVPWISETQFSFTDDGLLQSKIERPDAGPGKTLTKTFDYNVSGNIKTITESWVNAPGDTSLGFNSRVTSTEETFNSNSQRVVTTTTPLGQSVAVYHSVYDTPISQTDVNQMTTSTQYDELGRIKLISYPNNTNTVIDYRACDGCFSEAAHERAYTQTKTTGQAASRAYVDRLGRSVGSRSRGLDGRFIYTTVAYNSQGLPEQSTAPYYSGDVHQISTTYYDVLGRPKQILQPDSYSSYISYHGLKTLLTNVNGQTQKRYNSASGHVLRNIDHAETPVDFTYWPDGSTKTTEVGGGANPETRVCIGVDDMGRKNFLDDPNTGRITYAYNALGLLSAQTDANGQVTRYQYDQLGRTITRRDDAEGDNYLHTWSYDTQWLGLPDTLEGTTTDGGSYQETYTYNSYGQPTGSSATYLGRSWSSSVSYDDYGRPLKTTYPGGYAIANIYGDWGHLNQVVENTRQQILWQADEANALGQVTLSRLGDNSVVERIYTPETGRIEKITSTREGDTLMNQYYEFDALGNLLSRLDLLGNQAEAFCYDQLNRLKASRLDSCGSADVDFSYDSLGNILTKQGVTGTYQYGGNAGPHAVTSANGLSYHYDNNGNLVEARNSSNQVVRRVDYSVMNMPTHIEKGGRSTDIIYGATHKRIKRVDSHGSSVTRTTWYFGDRYEESTDAAGITRKTYYIGDFAQRIEEVQSGISYHEFLHKDHLGSIVRRSSDLSYSDLAATLFGAWGARLQGGWGSAPTGPDFNAHNVRGFTGHEHLDPVGLIHMNGRVYDPELGRFLSPDPVVQAPYNTQNYNRYSYVWNNPLSLVDPSGYYCRGPDSLSNLMIQTALSHIEGMHQQAAMDSVRFIAKVGALKAMRMVSQQYQLQSGGGAAGGDAQEGAQSPSASSQPVSSTTDDAKAQSASVKPASYESVKAVQDVKQTVIDDKSVVAGAQKRSSNVNKAFKYLNKSEAGRALVADFNTTGATIIEGIDPEIGFFQHV
ncbi:MAG TPA: RHS repeat-associated core domain-containing protein [Cellvibrio sp.]|nr:RHS repeat-associated core domain-containing protein [Cellvibrio sp.]